LGFLLLMLSRRSFGFSGADPGGRGRNQDQQDIDSGQYSDSHQPEQFFPAGGGGFSVGHGLPPLSSGGLIFFIFPLTL
jgi:hypothetical protein